jgi:hypothetical protein
MLELSSVLEGVAAAFAIVGGIYGTYEVVRRKVAAIPFIKSLSMFAGTNETRDCLLKLRGRTAYFDTVLDFCVWNELSTRIITETKYGKLLDQEASQLNGQRLPLYVVTAHGNLDSFASLVVRMKDSQRLKFSHGGTGVTQILLKGRFETEIRAYSGPSVEITLREV